MQAWLADYIFMADYALGVLMLVAIGLLAWRRVIGRFSLFAFALGCALGALWETAALLDMAYSARPVVTFSRPPPIPVFLHGILHCVWDGALFLIGLGLVRALCPAPHFARWRWSELGVLVLWGQTQELAVELIATYAGAWHWQTFAWNPALFSFSGQAITLLPQLIWLVAMLAYYPLVLLLSRTVPPFEAS